MKRYISLFLLAVVLMSCMVVPASAAENDNYVNVLDYCSADDSGSNYVRAENSTSVTFTYSCPVGPFRYVDMIVQSVNGPLSSISVNGTALTVLQIKTNFYRVYGSIPLASDLAFTATSTVTNARYNITQLKASFLKSFSSADTGFLSLATASSSSPYVYMADADTSAKISFSDYDSSVGLDGYINPVLRNYTVYAYPQNWRKYDTVDLYFSVRAASLNSLAVTFNDDSLPFTLSFVNSSGELIFINDFLEGSLGETFFDYDINPAETLYFHVSIDLSDVDRTYSSYPQIVFTGQYQLEDSLQHVTLLSVVGTVLTESQNSDSYWLMRLYELTDTFRAYTQYYLRELNSMVSTGFTNIGTWFSDQMAAIDSHFTNLESWIQNQTDSIVGAFDDFSADFSNLETWIKEQTAALQTEFTNLRSELFSSFTHLETTIQTSNNYIRAAIGDLGTNLDTWIQNQTAAIEEQFRQYRIAIKTHFERLTTDLQTEFTNLETSLDTWILNQTAAIEEQFRQYRIAIKTHFERLSEWIENQTTAIVDAIVGDPSSGDELEEDSQQIQDGVEDIGKFEEDQQAVLDDNFDDIQSAVTVTGFAASLAFVQKYTNMIFLGLGDVVIIISMPLFLGLFFYICSRVPGVTRWRPREPKGDSQ